jgi:hypothetical protein
VEARPSDEIEGTDEPRADRERVIETLKAAFVQGRIGKEEFDKRVGQALAAFAALDAVTADIPAVRPAAQALRSAALPARGAREAYNKRLVARGTAGGAGGIGLALDKNPGSQSSRSAPPPSADASHRPASAEQTARPRRLGPGQTGKDQWYATGALVTR